MVGEPNTAPVKTTTPVATQPVAATPIATPEIATIGEPTKSIFKTWWLWTIVVVIIALGIGAYFLFK